ncbi:hypothetical protein OAO42_00675 [Candidatus Izimaplasma bacterium]|nr:hypothetical protein [Candidatus Izimaplasma bacterium]
MAVLGIISLILLFVLFMFQFGNFEELIGKSSPKFDEDYYSFNLNHQDIEVTVEQEKIYNYMYASSNATFKDIELSCDAQQSDIDEMVFMGVLSLVKVEKSGRKLILFGILFLILMLALFYFANYYLLIRINLRYVGIIIYIGLLALFILNYGAKFLRKDENKALQASAVVIGFISVVLVFYLAFGGRTYFHANAYSELIQIQEDEFSTEVKTVDVETLPIVDKQYGAKLGSLKLGEYPGIGSEFETGEYSDIIYQGEQYLVAPLEYRGIFKWINNRKAGTPGYIMINKVTAETTLVNLREDTGDGMVYTPSAYFDTDIKRYAYMNGMNRYKHEHTFFEIDEAGTPYYVLQYSLPTIFINGGRDIAKIAVVNAITGTIGIYDPDDVPEWIESVYPPGLLLTQLNYWGRLQDGWINSIFGQKGVLQSSNGKRTIMNDGELFYFTGLTSAGSDESTIGFVYMNTRTKETTLFSFPGATEQAAMNKVLTLLPQNNISTAFPIPINVLETPTYFIAIKGEDGRILRYVFMNVKELEVYGISDKKTKAHTDYLLSLSSTTQNELDQVTGDITDITSYVSEGNTIYWIELDNDETYLLNVSTVEVIEMMYFVGKDLGDEITFKIQDNTVIEIVLPE